VIKPSTKEAWLVQRPLLFRQPMFDADGKFLFFHYWGALTENTFISPDSSWSIKRRFDQFTGLYDINFKAIYERDIIQEGVYKDIIWGGDGVLMVPATGVVTYETKMALFDVEAIETGRVLMKDGNLMEIHLSKYDGLFMWNSDTKLTVIGNVYE
jgi:hypothetical protein